MAGSIQRTNHHNLAITMQLSWTQVKNLYTVASIGGSCGELLVHVRMPCVERG